MTTVNRSKEWLNIWEKKYATFDKGIDTHIFDGLDGLSLKEWQTLVRFFSTAIDIRDKDSVLEVGCGAGAFLKELKCREMYGVDYSYKAIEAARQILEGTFLCSEAQSLPFENDQFDKVISFGVFVYFNSLESASLAFEEMMRVVKPTGTIFIGDINDLSKKTLAEALRTASSQERKEKYVSKKEIDHLYIPKSFFEALALKHDWQITFIDEAINLPFYYNAQYRYSITLKKQSK